MSVGVRAVTRQTEGDDRENRVGEEESQRGEETDGAERGVIGFVWRIFVCSTLNSL